MEDGEGEEPCNRRSKSPHPSKPEKVRSAAVSSSFLRSRQCMTAILPDLASSMKGEVATTEIGTLSKGAQRILTHLLRSLTRPIWSVNECWQSLGTYWQHY